MNLTRVLLALIFLGLGQAPQDHPDYRFALYFNPQELTRPERAREFEEQYVRHEAPYFKTARHPEWAIAYDGINLDPVTGKIKSLRAYGAPCKESLDLAILTKAIEGNHLAALLVSPDAPEKAPAIAVDMLTRKLKFYHAWKAKFPGMRGYMVWLKPETLEPNNFGGAEIPGLDNGEWIWAMAVTERELRMHGYTDLAKGYAEYLDGLRKEAVPLFWDPVRHLCRANVRVKDPKVADTPIIPRDSYMQGEHGVHEGIMILTFLTVLGKDLPQGASDSVWASTRMTRVETKYGTTWQGWNGSAHESWQYLFLPMRDLPEFRQLFRIREVIRSQNAVARHYPGFATAAIDPRSDGLDYLDGAGIEDVGSQKLRNQDIYTLYGAFPSLLVFSDDSAKPNLALQWVLNMLKPAHMQGPMGAGECGTNDGTHVTPVKSCDGTYLNLIALMGGLERETAEMLKEQGVYQRFVDILRNEYIEGFGSAPLKEPCGFVGPNESVPQGLLPEYRADPAVH